MSTRPKTSAGPDGDQANGVEETWADEFIARNRDVLIESIRRAREDAANGIVASRTMEDIIEDGRRRRRQS